MKFIIVFVLTMLLGYLVGSFVAATFDITEWDVFGRFIVAAVSTFLASMVGATVQYD